MHRWVAIAKQYTYGSYMSIPFLRLADGFNVKCDGFSSIDIAWIIDPVHESQKKGLLLNIVALPCYFSRQSLNLETGPNIAKGEYTLHPKKECCYFNTKNNTFWLHFSNMFKRLY